MERLSTLFEPDAVGVIGATDREGAVGRAILENLQAGFAGDIVAINPGRETVFDRPCYPDVESAPAFDLAVVVVPPTAVVDALESLGEAGVRHVVVITAGFGETGAKGAERERELRAVADAYDLTLVGPNSLGVMSTGVGLNASFGPQTPRRGPISLLSQSGAFVTAVIDWANDQGLGFRHVVSLGNKAVLDEVDLLRAWGEDPDTRVIVGYLEGIDRGEAFIEAAREVARETPIVLVKAGRTTAGAAAASSHTGAIAGSERAYEAALDQAGVIRARSVQELFDYARTLAGLPIPDADGVAVVTNAGGPGVLTTDAVGDSRLEMASFADETVEALTAALPESANVYNPIDAIGDADATRFDDALDVVLDDPAVGSVVVVAAPTAVLRYDRLAEVVIENQTEHDKPVVTSLMGGQRSRGAEEALREFGVPNYFDPARAVDGLDSLVRYREIRDRPADEPTTYDVDRERARSILERVQGRDGNRLGIEAMDLLEAYGVPIPAGAVVDDPAEARTVAEAIDGDVVMKIASPDIAHKVDIGGVKLGVPDDEVEAAYEDLVSRARRYQPDAHLLGVQVQERIDLDGATETIVGSNRDPQFGPLVLFGLGGTYVEVLEDTAVRVAPFGEGAARQMVDGIQAAPLLRGARGREPADVDALVESIGRLAQLVTDFPAIVELDVNPLVARSDGVVALDLVVTLDPEEL